MNIYFKTTRLEKIFNSEALLVKEYGQNTADEIMERMAVLQAAPSLKEVSNQPPERRHKLKGKLKDMFAVDLDKGNRLIFKPEEDAVQDEDNNNITDLSNFTSITINAVGDYH